MRRRRGWTRRRGVGRVNDDKKSCNYFFFSSLSPLLLSLAYRRPQALQRDFGPSGPYVARPVSSAQRRERVARLAFLHSGESTVPQSRQTNSPSSTRTCRYKSQSAREAEHESERRTFFFFSEPPDISPLFPVLLIPIPSAP